MSDGALGTATWTTISQVTEDCHNGTPLFKDLVFGSTSGQAFTANQYFRLVVTNKASGGVTPLPPNLIVNLRIKAPHV